jgi:hypothetical protein
MNEKYFSREGIFQNKYSMKKATEFQEEDTVGDYSKIRFD